MKCDLPAWFSLVSRLSPYLLQSGQGMPCLPRLRQLAGLGLAGLVVFEAPLALVNTRFPAALHAASNATHIFSLAPSCAVPGETITLVGNGLGSENVLVKVGGIPAQVLSATGNRVTFAVPSEVPGGVTMVTATNPGGQTGSIAFRVKTQEVCGDQTDDNCDGRLNDPEVCTIINHPPIARAGAAQTAPVGASVALDGTASSDPDGNPLTFHWEFTSKPTNSTTTLTNTASPTPSFRIDQPGTYVVQVRVSDGTLTHTASVSVSTVNSAPVAKGTNQSGQVGAIVTLDGSASSDVDGNPLTFHWTLVSQPTGSTATLTAPTTVAPSFIIDVFGDYLVQLVVHDGITSSAPDTVTISTLNSAPVANAGADQSAYVGETVTLDGSRSSDLDGNPLIFQWVLISRPTNSSAVLLQATRAQPTVTIDKPGVYVVQLTVNDGIATSEADPVVISTLNSKPVANAGADQSGTVGTTMHLDGSGSSDVDGDPLTAQWSLTNQPAAGSTTTLQNSTTLTPTFVLDKSGTYVAQLIVNDGIVSSEADTVIVSTLNSKPVANAGADQSGTVGTTMHLDGSGSSDVDGDPLTYAWALTTTPTDSTATLSDPTAVQPTFGLDKPGIYTAQLLVHDGTVESIPVIVTISTVNSKPIAHPGLAQHGTVGTTVQLNGSNSRDVDGDALTYQWSFTTKPATSAAALQGLTSVTPSLVLDKAGTYTVQLYVS